MLRIVRNSLWLSLAHIATPPFPQKSRSVRLLGCKRPPDGSLSLPTFADFRSAARAVPTGVQTELRAEPSLPLTRKVARRRRDGRRESNKYQIFVISPSVIFQKKNDSSLVRGSLCLQYGLKRRTKSTITIKLQYTLYRRGELCSPAFNLL